MKINDFLLKENNNLDVVRLILAALVIYSHVPVFENPGEHVDVLADWFSFTNSGQIAVTSFFFISGLLVSNSLFSKSDCKKYVVSRFFRLMPGLLAVSVFMATVGLFFTDMGWREYFPLAWHYVEHNFRLNIQFEIPGVSFMHDGFNNPIFSRVLNGSLWTIPLEVYMYLLVMSLFFVAKCTTKKVIAVVLLLGVFSPVYAGRAHVLGGGTEYMIPAFFLGALFAHYKTLIDLQWYFPLGLLLSGGIIINPEAHNWLTMMGIVLFFVWLSSTKVIRMIKLPRDISYGVYLFGWPAEQLLSWFFPHIGYWSFLLFSIFISGVMGTILNIFVEIPSQRISRYVCSKLE